MGPATLLASICPHNSSSWAKEVMTARISAVGHTHEVSRWHSYCLGKLEIGLCKSSNC